MMPDAGWDEAFTVERVGILSEEQREVLREFLLLVAKHEPSPFVRDRARKALDATMNADEKELKGIIGPRMNTDEHG